VRAAVMAIALATAAPAGAGMLLEGELAGTPVRLELGGRPDRVAATVDGADHLLVDLDRAEVLRGGERVGPNLPPVAAEGALERWSDGPLVAGYGTSYQVLIVGERICGEALTVGWMAGFTDPLARALSLLERSVPRLAPRPREGCSAALGFASFDRGAAFPLLAGDRAAAPLFRADWLRFDHYPPETRFALPGEPAALTCPAPFCPPPPLGGSPAP
jgi:hypothetical protein